MSNLNTDIHFIFIEYTCISFESGRAWEICPTIWLLRKTIISSISDGISVSSANFKASTMTDNEYTHFDTIIYRIWPTGWNRFTGLNQFDLIARQYVTISIFARIHAWRFLWMCNRYELCLRFIYTGICNFCVEIINYLHRKNSMVNRQIVNVEKLVGSWGVYWGIFRNSIRGKVGLGSEFQIH